MCQSGEVYGHGFNVTNNGIWGMPRERNRESCMLGVCLGPPVLCSISLLWICYLITFPRHATTLSSYDQLLFVVTLGLH